MNQIPVEDHRRIVEAVHQQHRFEVGVMQMQLVRYAEALKEAGIEVEDADTDELMRLWRDSAAVISTASEFVEKLGSAKELLGPGVYAFTKRGAA